MSLLHEQLYATPSLGAVYGPEIVYSPPNTHIRTRREAGCGRWIVTSGAAGTKMFQRSCESAHCDKCGPMLAQSAYRQLLAAIDAGPLYMASVSSDEAKAIVRDQGRKGVYRLPGIHTDIVFNRKVGERLYLPPSVDTILVLMRSVPDGKRRSGALIRPTLEWEENTDEMVEPVTIRQEFFSATGRMQAIKAIADQAQDEVLDSLPEPTCAEDLQAFVDKHIALVKARLVDAGHKIRWSNERYVVCDLSVYRDLYTRRLNDTGRIPEPRQDTFLAFGTGLGERIPLEEMLNW